MQHHSKRDAINAETQGLRRCAWPDCKSPTFLPATIRGITFEQRTGPLCEEHADLITDATLERRVQAADHYHQTFTLESAEIRLRRDADERRKKADSEARKDQPGWIYYLLVGERLKIGYSADVRRRLKSYPPGSELLAVEPGSPTLEKQRHADFRQYLVDGREWFRPSDELKTHTDALVDMHGRPTRYAHKYRQPGAKAG